MKLKDFFDALKDAQKNIEQFHFILDAMMVLEADYRFFNVAHGKFLPAAKDYRNYIKGIHGSDKQSAQFKSIRGRLGAYSRLYYKAQKETFIKLINLVVPSFLSRFLNHTVEHLWQTFKNAEVKWMAHGRAH